MRLVSLISLAALAVGCAEGLDVGEDPELGTGEGVDFDAENPDAVLDDGKSDLPRYMIPTDLPKVGRDGCEFTFERVNLTRLTPQLHEERTA